MARVLRYEVSVTVDEDAWIEYYGTRPAVDIKEMIHNLLFEFAYKDAKIEPGFLDVEVKIPVEITIVPTPKPEEKPL